MNAKQTHQHINYSELRREFKSIKPAGMPFKWLMVAVVTLFLLYALYSIAYADNATVNVNRLANAIYKAENSKKHPYGILAHYKHTTPRQACINTIKHALKRWDGRGDFIAFLGKTYAPCGFVLNDPLHLNNNWTRNVRYYYERG